MGNASALVAISEPVEWSRLPVGGDCLRVRHHAQIEDAKTGHQRRQAVSPLRPGEIIDARSRKRDLEEEWLKRSTSRLPEGTELHAATTRLG